MTENKTYNKILFRLLFLVMFIILFMVNLAHANVNTVLPKNYHGLKDNLYSEIHRLMPDFYLPPYFGALIEHESCISITHSKCWNSQSRLKTSREEGAGLPQLTRAWTVDGKLRFDTLTDLVRRYPGELKGLSWNNVYDRPDLQIRAMLLLWSSNFKLFKNKDIDYWSMVAFSDSAYNGGYNDVSKGMTACKLKVGCEHKVWFGNVENIIIKSTKPLYAGRSANDINKHHVRDVLLTRFSKYVKDWDDNGYVDRYPIKID